MSDEPTANRLPGGERKRPSQRTLVRVGLPVVAVAVAAAVAVVLLVSPSPPAKTPAGSGMPARPRLTVFQLPPGALGSTSSGGTASGRQTLLAVAQTAARAAQPAVGRYWVTPAMAGNFIEVGSPEDHYLVLEKVATQFWAARSPGDNSPTVEQPVGVQFATAADEAAWRRAGSPTEWTTSSQQDGLADPQGYADSGRLAPLSAGIGKPEVTPGNAGDPPFSVGNEVLWLSGLQALPADPATLKSMLMQVWNAGYGTPQAYLLQVIPPILEMPLRPAVRSAFYQVLAGLPGVMGLGAGTDAAGQRGVAVGYSSSYSACGGVLDLGGNGAAGFQTTFTSCTVQQILVMDPATGFPLAEELRYARLPSGQTWGAPGGLFSYEIYGTAFSTNATAPA